MSAKGKDVRAIDRIGDRLAERVDLVRDGTGASSCSAQPSSQPVSQIPVSQIPMTQMDEPNIDDLVREHHRAVYAYAYRLAGNSQDAEDVTQQAFLVAQQNLSQLRSLERARGWLLAIARSQYCRLCRRKRPFLADDAEIELEQIATQGDDGPEYDEERLQAALETMSPPYRMVVLMYYMEHHSYREIAEQLEIPIGTVMSRLARAKSQLRLALGGENA